MAVIYSRYKFVTASFLKRFRNGHLASETAVVKPAGTWLDPVLYNSFRGGEDYVGRGYRNMYKISQGHTLNAIHWRWCWYQLPVTGTWPFRK
jgi:hypothetical protein